MSGGKGGGDTTQKTEPWSGQKPFLTYGFDQAKNLYQSGGPQYYPNATYVPFSGQTEQALGMAQNRAMGSPNEQGLNNYLGGSLQGNWLNSNPYLDAMYGSAAGRMTESFNESVLPGLNATFGGAGRTGSGAHALSAGRAAGELGDSLAGLSANIYGGNYANERGLMQQAAGMVPTASALDWNNIAQMGQVGQRVEGKAGEVLGDSMNRFNYNQNLPEQNLQRYIAAIQGNYGGTTQQSTNGQGGLNGALGGAMSGAAVGSMFGMPWLGAIGGGLLGVLQ
jgi:hypothetical protein